MPDREDSNSPVGLFSHFLLDLSSQPHCLQVGSGTIDHDFRLIPFQIPGNEIGEMVHQGLVFRGDFR